MTPITFLSRDRFCMDQVTIVPPFITSLEHDSLKERSTLALTYHKMYLYHIKHVHAK
jgi:hypothetical protein